MKLFNRIINQITIKKRREENKDIMNIVLPPHLHEWEYLYNQVGHRDGYVWRIYLRAKNQLDFIPVLGEYKTKLEIVNFLVTMYVVFIDDVADKEKNGDLLNLLCKIPFDHSVRLNGKIKSKETKYLDFVKDIWNEINKEITKFTNYEKFRDIFYYDVKCIVNSIMYDQIINEKKYLINFSDSILIQVQSMKFMVLTSLDLMCSPKLSEDKIGLIREISIHVQKMLRIGNWISTWEREARENDFTSGVFAYAISNKIVSLEELESKNSDTLIQKIKKEKVVNHLLNIWNASYKDVSRLIENSKDDSFGNILVGLENLLKLELISVGRK